MPNRSSDISSGYVDSHSAVFSPKSTDPANLGVNMCINILEGDNSPRVKDSTIKDVSQRFHNMKINVSESPMAAASTLVRLSLSLQTNSDNDKKPIDNSNDFHADDGKQDGPTGDSALKNVSHKQSPRASPGHISTDLSNSNNNENLAANNPMGGPHGDVNDSGMPSSMINGMPTVAVPIPFQRMQSNNQQQQQHHHQQQQQQQQQQQMLLYQQQQQQQQQA